MTDVQRRVEAPERIAAVVASGLLGMPESPGLDRLVGLAARLLAVPTTVITLVTGDRQVFASQLGLAQPWADAGQTPLSHSLCQYIVDDDAPLVVTDARTDLRLRDSGAVTELGVVAYAGVPVRVGGQTLGAFCAIEGQPREWSTDDLMVLADLAAAAESEIALLRAAQLANEGDAALRKVADLYPDAYVSINADGGVLEWNPAAERLFGWRRDEAVGVQLADLIVGEPDRTPHRAVWAQTGGRPIRPGHAIELSAVDRAGRAFPVELVLQSVETIGRRVFHAFLRDVSEHTAIDEKLRRQGELIDAAPAAITVRDLDGTIRSWNKGAEKMYGWPAAAVLGRNIHRLLCTEVPGGLPELGRALSEDGRWQGELAHRRMDGQMIFALTWHTVRPGAGGVGLEIVETCVDVSERRRAEEALATSELHFRIQFDQSTIGQVVIGLDGRLIRVNSAYAQMVGLTPARLHGRLGADFIHPDDRAEELRLLAGLFAGEYESYECTQRLVGVGGKVLDVQAGARLEHDAEGRPSHLVGVIQDITAQRSAQRERDAAYDALRERNAELQRVNAELEEANLLKLDLMGMLSHDIGTPLASILGYSEILTDSALMPELAIPATKVVRAANRIDELRHNVLSMYSLDTARLQTERTPVALMAALQDAADAADTDVLIGGPADAAVLVDPAQLQQIIVNFLTNAAKYAGGATSITVTEQPTTYTIAVHDHGAGVPVELRDRLFERFSRASNANAPGHGLGLHIAASLAEANDGTVGYRDNEPTGSTFTLDLPRAPGHRGEA